MCHRYNDRVEMWRRQQNMCVNGQAGVSAAASFSPDHQDGWWYECFTDCPTKLCGIGYIVILVFGKYEHVWTM